jgi:hypothetical protein
VGVVAMEVEKLSESNGLKNINSTVLLESIVKSNEVVTEPDLRSQSILSNVGTKSSGQKDSGFIDLVGRSEEDINSSDGFGYSSGSH